MASIHIKGIDEALKRYDKRLEAANKEVADLVNIAAAAVQGQAIELVPVDTGALKQSIKVHEARPSDAKMQASVYSDKEYAPYVEYGTGVRGAATAAAMPKDGALSYGDTAGQIAQPYMKPAVDLTRPKVNKLAAAYLQKILRK